MNIRSQVAVWLMLSAPVASKAAELKPDTVKAWDEHIRVVNLRMQERLRVNSRFLWIDEAEDRSRRVRGGEILVAPAGEQNPKHVRDGLVHHWMGAAFHFKRQDLGRSQNHPRLRPLQGVLQTFGDRLEAARSAWRTGQNFQCGC